MRLILALALLALPSLAFADSGKVQVEHVWSRAMPSGGTGVIYLTIIDNGGADTLTGVTSPVAEKAELHETINDHGVMKMRSVASLTVAPGKPITLAPDGYHIMLVGLKHALVAGTSFPVTLTFTHAGTVKAMASVEKAGATMPGMAQGSMGNMPMGSMGSK